jgi:phosphate transport system permease protein
MNAAISNNSDLAMQAALIILITTSMLVFWRNSRKARLLLVKSHRIGEKQWHAKPVHFGIYGAGRTLILALLVLLSWWTLRDNLADTFASSQMAMSSSEQMTFHLHNNLKTLSAKDVAALSDSQKAWYVHYNHFLAYGDNIIFVIVGVLMLYGVWVSYRSVHSEFYARKHVEKWIKWWLFAAAAFSILITLLILMSVIYEAILFFSKIPLFDFLFGLEWSPQTAIREDQAGASGAFGIVPLFLGTILITLIALFVAVPIGLFSAIYMTQYASATLRNALKPMLEILASIPTVVYGFFAITVMAPFLRDAAAWLGLSVASESALAAGLVMGIMIIPLISSLADDAISSVPRMLRDASLGLGATTSETVKHVILPAALPGIMGGVLLAVSRAIGETMIVVMAAGLAGNLTFNPLESVTTITAQIVSLIGGDQEFDSAKTLAAFALGLTLFIFTLILNVVALHLVKRYREAYE